MVCTRFIEAQDQPPDGFASALAEMRAGRKRGHWIWYVFPQLGGLGSSEASRVYGIRGLPEAKAYLRNPLLCSRLLEITTAVAEQPRRGIAIDILMGSSIDASKLVSSLTLFGHVARDLGEDEGLDDCRQLTELAEGILHAADGAGYAACSFTLGVLAGASHRD